MCNLTHIPHTLQHVLWILACKFSVHTNYKLQWSLQLHKAERDETEVANTKVFHKIGNYICLYEH